MEYHTVFFGNERFRTMAKVLGNSIEHNSNHGLTVHELPKGKETMRHKLVVNTRKLHKWVEIVENAKDDIVLMDCDTVLLKEVSHVFDMDFDIAYTKRTQGSRFPLNGGVVFVRPNKKTKDFFRRWLDVNNRMMEDSHFHKPYYKKYAGINQASFGYLLENGCDLKIIDVPCSKYNACDAVDWENLEYTHILHVKSDLQNQCFAKEPTRHLDAVKLWMKFLS